MKIDLEAADLQPLVQQIVREVIDQREADDAKLNGRLGYTEAEAAGLLGVQPHVLRDARRRGEIHAKLVGKRYIYSRAAILAWLASEDWH